MRARENPFAVHRVLTVRYRLNGTTWEELLSRLATRRYRGAIVGPEGRGKTTLLEDLAPRLALLGFRVRWAERGFGRTPLTSQDAVLFDGADRLSSFDWLRFRLGVRTAGGVIVTSHREGLLPTLVRCETSPSLLTEIVRSLVGEEAAAGLPPAEVLFARHGGNLRTALRELYDVFSSDSIVSEKTSTSAGIV